jgi:hypothetical protein
MAGYDPNQPRDDKGKWTSEEKWYNRYEKSWVVQRKDAEGNQVGDADYVYTKREAEAIVKEYEAERASWGAPKEDEIVSAAWKAAGVDKFSNLASELKRKFGTNEEIDFQDIITLSTIASEADHGLLNEILLLWHERQMAIPKKHSLTASDFSRIETLRHTGKTASKAIKGQRFK